MVLKEMNSRGKLSELKAAQYIVKKNYRIVDYNFSCRFGEIDIIAVNKNYIVFVEVKMRDVNSIAKPKEFVDYKKQQRIIATANYYLARHKTKLQPRFDVIEVVCENNEIKSINHIENAFTLV